jgi:hypothetical protein
VRPLASVSGVRLISLQFKEGKEQLGKLPIDLHVEGLDGDFDLGDDAFLDAAALLEVVDLVVSCDTGLAHLAGALARPVWIALNEAPEWRWQRGCDNCIWYPTARLFRQDSKGDWDGVFSRMRDALDKLLSNQTASGGSAVRDRSKLQPQMQVSWGELLDKITILEIKSERLSSPVSVENVRRELVDLETILRSNRLAPEIETKRLALRATNEKLWDIENDIRGCEAEQCFDERFTALARNIYILNDERTRIKQDINACMKSSLLEEKEYRSYNNRHGE